MNLAGLLTPLQQNSQGLAERKQDKTRISLKNVSLLKNL